MYADRDLKLYARTVSSWNPECQARPESSKARFFQESNLITHTISEANSDRIGLLLNGRNRKGNSLLKKGINDEKKKAIAYPWIQFGFVAFQTFCLSLYWLISCQFETKRWAGKDREDREGTHAFLYMLAFAMTVMNVVSSSLMIKLILADRAKLSGIFDPIYKYSGCYEVPYVYLDEGALTTWPSVARRALAYVIFCGIVQPLLLFTHAFIYSKLLTETLRIADNPELLNANE